MCEDKRMRKFIWYTASKRNVYFITKDNQIYYSHHSYHSYDRNRLQVFLQYGNIIKQKYSLNGLTKIATEFVPEKHFAVIPKNAEEVLE